MSSGDAGTGKGRPEPAHGLESSGHGGLADLSGLGSAARSGGSEGGSVGRRSFAGDELVLGGVMRFVVTVDGVAYDVSVEAVGDESGVVLDPGVGDGEPAAREESSSGALGGAGEASGVSSSLGGRGRPVTCPVSGTVVKVLVAAGQAVEADDVLVLVEALKVESRVLAPRAGVVSEVCVSSGQAVGSGDALVRLDG